jgi:hypothetical protein
MTALARSSCVCLKVIRVDRRHIFVGYTADSHFVPFAAIRGVGDPLVAMYARAYLCTKTVELAPYYNVKDSEPNPLLACFDDFLFSFKALKNSQWKVCVRSF